MLEDSKLVPAVVNTLRFSKLVTHLFRSDDSGRNESKGQGQGHIHPSSSTSSSTSVVLSFHDFQRLLVGVSQGVPPVDPQTSKLATTPRDQKKVCLVEPIVQPSPLPCP